MESSYIKKIEDFDKSIATTKEKISTIESRIIVNRKGNEDMRHTSRAGYTTPNKPESSSAKGPLTNTAQSYSENKAEDSKELLEFLKQSATLRDVLQEKAKYTQLQYEKERMKWEGEKKKLNEQISSLERKISDKDVKMSEMIENIANLKAELKIVSEKNDALTQDLLKTNQENKRYRQQNSQIKQQNKNLKADNKIIVAHLDKLIKGKMANEQKMAANLFDQRERRVIQSLYKKAIPTDPKQKPSQLLPSERNELSNKVKFQQLSQQYQTYYKQSSMSLQQLKKELEVRDVKIDEQACQIRFLEQSIISINELRDLERQAHDKRKKTLEKVENQYKVLHQQNQHLKFQILPAFKIPKIKGKIGCLIKTTDFGFSTNPDSA